MNMNRLPRIISMVVNGHFPATNSRHQLLMEKKAIFEEVSASEKG